VPQAERPPHNPPDIALILAETTTYDNKNAFWGAQGAFSCCILIRFGLLWFINVFKLLN
jgi:hypothetical protein